MKLHSRHYAFAGLALVVVVTMLLPFRPKVEVTADSLQMYQFIESIPE